MGYLKKVTEEYLIERIGHEKVILKAQREQVLKTPEKASYWRAQVQRQEWILGNLQRDLELMKEGEYPKEK